MNLQKNKVAPISKPPCFSSTLLWDLTQYRGFGGRAVVIFSRPSGMLACIHGAHHPKTQAATYAGCKMVSMSTRRVVWGSSLLERLWGSTFLLWDPCPQTQWRQWAFPTPSVTSQVLYEPSSHHLWTSLVSAPWSYLPYFTPFWKTRIVTSVPSSSDQKLGATSLCLWK